VNTKKMTNQNKTLVLVCFFITVLACWKISSMFVCVMMEPSLGKLIMQEKEENSR
jgi:hypothetical protein